MKKMIMAMAVAVAAFAVNAASIDWSISSIGSSPDVTASAGMAAYLVDGSKYADFAALSGEAVVAFLSDSNNYIATEKTVKASRGGAINLNGANAGSYNPGDAVSAFMVIFDGATPAEAKNYSYTAVKGSVVAESGANVSLAWGAYSTAMSAQGAGSWASTSVPEPTSGLLLLLGMAGLALKRKHA